MSNGNYDYWNVETGEGIYEHELEEQFNEFLDECYPPFQFGDVSYDVSNVLKSTDPQNWTQEFLNYVDSELKAGNITEDEPVEDDTDD